MAAVFRHSPINYKQAEVRLFRLLPSSSPNDIQCRSEVVCLNDTKLPSYVALSYAWGKVTNLWTIQIDDERFEVWENLHHFLQELHTVELPNASVAKAFWADAICIDQHNIEEKNYQVRHISKVFSRADLMVIWLGPSDRFSRSLSDLSRSYDQHLPSAFASNDCNESIDSPEHFLDDVERMRARGEDLPDLPTICACVTALTRRKYWTRQWIVQEFTLAADSILLCGTNIITLRMWKLCLALLQWSKGILSPVRVEESRLFESLPLSHETEEQARAMANGLIQMRNTADSREGRLVGGFGETWSSLSIFECSEPNDKVFALLGMFLNGLDFPVDYRDNWRIIIFKVLQHFEVENALYLAHDMIRYSIRSGWDPHGLQAPEGWHVKNYTTKRFPVLMNVQSLFEHMSEFSPEQKNINSEIVLYVCECAYCVDGQARGRSRKLPHESDSDIQSQNDIFLAWCVAGHLSRRMFLLRETQTGYVFHAAVEHIDSLIRGGLQRSEQRYLVHRLDVPGLPDMAFTRSEAENAGNLTAKVGPEVLENILFTYSNPEPWCRRHRDVDPLDQIRRIWPPLNKSVGESEPQAHDKLARILMDKAVRWGNVNVAPKTQENRG